MELLALQVRFDNYCLEEQVLESKLVNPNIPESKRGRISVRLRDIQERLLPQVRRQLAT